MPTVGREPRGPHGSMNSPLRLVVVDTGSGGEDSARLPIFLVAGGHGATALARALSSKGTPSPVIGAGAQRVYTFPGLGTLLAKRIADREFIDMRELLLEAWRVDAQTAVNSQSKSSPRGPKLWVECYAMLAGVLVSVYPEKAPHFMAICD